MLAIQDYHNGQDNVVARGTTNYGLFKFDPQNRPVDNEHLQKLYDSIVRRNLLREFPVLVDENFTVIDGQHRLRCAQSLGVPIYYIVSSRISMDDIIDTTDNVSKWKSSDYLHRWCAAGNINYIALREFWHKYKEYNGKRFLSLSHAMDLCHYGDRARMSGRFSSGEYICNDVPFAESVAMALIDFSKYVSFYNDTVFIYVVQNLLANREYEHSVMMAKMKFLSSRLVKCADMDSYMELITKHIYNYKKPRDQHVILRKLSSSDRNWRVDRKKIKMAA